MPKQAFFLTTITEEQIEDYIECYPALGERVRNWQPIAQVDDKLVVHVIADIAKPGQADRLKNHADYLGKDYREIAQRAKASDPVCKAVIKKIVFTNWEIDNPSYPEEGPERINYRGSLGEWIAAGRPERLSGWQVAHDWAGNGLERPGESEVG